MCPIETEKGIFDAILEGHIDFESSPWPSISNGAKDLVSKMLTQDPKKRITSGQVLGMQLLFFFLLIKYLEFIKHYSKRFHKLNSLFTGQKFIYT